MTLSCGIEANLDEMDGGIIPQHTSPDEATGQSTDKEEDDNRSEPSADGAAETSNKNIDEPPIGEASGEGNETTDDGTDKPEDRGSDSHSDDPHTGRNSARSVSGFSSPVRRRSYGSPRSSPPLSPADSHVTISPEEYPDDLPPSFPWHRPTSKSKEAWEWQKTNWKLSNKALEGLMRKVGLETAKARLLEINTFVEVAKRQKVRWSEDNFNTTFIGNPGTGKTTVAEIYAKFLLEIRVITNSDFEKTTAAELISNGPLEIDRIGSRLEWGGVLLVEGAQDLVWHGSNSSNQSLKLELLFSTMKRLRGTAVIVFTGYGKRMEDLPAQHAAYSTTIPNTIRFPDYEDYELHRILIQCLKSRFKRHPLEIEDGNYGVFLRIVARRIGRGRGKDGFGNAREVQNAVTRILTRQANRLFLEEKSGKLTDDHFLTQEDLLGPPPSSIFDNSKAWKKLNGMIGLQAVKDTIKALIYRLQINYERDLAEKPLVECSLNKLFIGNPGTGKTTVAKLYGQILTEIGLLSKGDVIVKSPSDFVGSAIGHSEQNTKSILDSAKGKVLIIDEAYGLAGSSTGGRHLESADSFRGAVIDTIVADVQSTGTEDRAVLLLGYRERMESMLNETNPALARRFPLASAFVFENYTHDQLGQILDLKLKEQGFKASGITKKVMMEALDRTRSRPGFGNAGEVDILLDRVKLRQQQRLSNSSGGGNTDAFEPVDVDEAYDRADRDTGNIRRLFSNYFGFESVIEKLETYKHVVMNSRALNRDPRENIPFTFLFCGPPGTGKTSAAKEMGKVFYDMGLLATKEILEHSASDLIGEYVGHTGPKTKKVFTAALGRVLFIDEAYMLGEGSFGREAMVEIVNTLTLDRFRNQLVTILAGYEPDINKLMAINPGLTSRFPVVIHFNPLSMSHCVDLLLHTLKLRGLDTSSLEFSKKYSNSLEVSFEKLTLLPSWGNARDVQTLASAIHMSILGARTGQPSLVVSEEIVMNQITTMTRERRTRAPTTRSPRRERLSTGPPLREHAQMNMMPPPPKLHTTKSTNMIEIKSASQKSLDSNQTAPEINPAMNGEDTASAPGPMSSNKRISHDLAAPYVPGDVLRDPGVSDAVWEELQLDKAAARQRQNQLVISRQMVAELGRQASEAQRMIAKGTMTAEWSQKLKTIQSKLWEATDELERLEEAAAEETRIQKLLKGKCTVGFNWTRQAGGWRCEGGGHFISFDQMRNSFSGE